MHAAPLLSVRLDVEVMVPPETATMPAAEIPASVPVPPFTVNVPLALTVIKPDTVNAPPVVTVTEAPVPLLLILMVVIETVLLIMG